MATSRSFSGYESCRPYYPTTGRKPERTILKKLTLEAVQALGPGEKTCTRCGRCFALAAFYVKKGDLRQSRCKLCYYETTETYRLCPDVRAARAKRISRYRREVRYGLTESDYEKMLTAQQHRCGICDQPETKVSKGILYRLSVDHDHTTGRNRMLLCHKCNRALGNLQESPELLRKAAQYIEHFRQMSGPCQSDRRKAEHPYQPKGAARVPQGNS